MRKLTGNTIGPPYPLVNAQKSRQREAGGVVREGFTGQQPCWLPTGLRRHGGSCPGFPGADIPAAC